MWQPMTSDYIAGALTAAVLVGGFAFWRAGFLRRERARLEALVAERTRELRASEAKFRGIFENAVEGVFQSSLDGRNLAANPAMARICGYRDPEELRAAVTDVATHFYVEPGRRDEINARLARDGVVVGCESEIRRRDGHTLWVSENVRLVHDAATGQDVYLGSIVDITEKRAAQEGLRAATRAAEAANRAKSAFLANMSHELRTPLNGILGFVRVMRRDPLTDARFRERLAIVDGSGEQLLHLINEVLDLSKIEAGKMELHPGPCSLPALLMGLNDVFAPRAAEKNLAFACGLDRETVPAMVRADEPRLRQVLTNLLDNAFKFTDHGAVELRVTGGGGSGPVVFEVRDTGGGIAPDQQEIVFQPFHQLDGGPRGTLPGTGLGLSISRRLVELMGGELRVESAPGRGSCFRFGLELTSTALPPGTSSRPRPRITGHRGPPRRALVVDDDGVNRSVARELFEQVGFQVNEARGGEECLELAARVTPDLVLLDLRMAPLDGFETARRLRQVGVAGTGTKILASSAGVLSAREQESVAASCDGFLPKPLDVDGLFDRVGELLGLAWTYDDHDAEAPAPGGGPPSALLLPPAEEIAALLDLARQGDVIKLRARLRQPQNQAGAHAAFVEKIDALAAGFQLGRITRALQEAQATLVAGQAR